ncbi:MAG TPA: glycosyltransferase family 9 protein [Nitrospiraceae bacterium]|nr:glycosyltransferase family 9 protein [Nitrospiraceae bacterium]
MHNILIIKPGAIGDVLQLTPVIRALKSKYPDAEITLLVGSAATAELFRYNPSVRETVVYDKRGEHKSIMSFIRLWKRLRTTEFDLVINFQRSNVRAWLLASASFPSRILVYHKAKKRIVHAVVNYLDTLAPLGILSANLDLELSPGPDARAFAENLLSAVKANNKPLIALNPGASHPLKQWGSGQFAELASILFKELSASIIIVGGSDDIALSEEIARRTVSRPLLLAGKLDLLQLGAILEQCDLLVSGDTGPMHIATAVGTRVAGLFGSTDPARTGPVGQGHRVIQAKGVPCVPCRSLICQAGVYLECMKKLSPEYVYDVIHDMLYNEQAVR